MSFLKKSASVFSTRIFLFVLAMFRSIVVTRLLGPHYRGMLEILNTLPQLIVNVGTLGIGNANTYFIGRNKYPTQKVISNSLGVAILLGSFLLLSSFVIVCSFRKEIFAGIPTFYIILAFSVIPFYLLNNLVRYSLLGKENIYARNKLILFSGIFNFCFVILLVYFLDMGILGVLISLITTTVLTSLLGLYQITFFSRISISFDAKMTLDSIKFGLMPYLALVVMNLNYRADVLLIKMFLNSKELGYYAVGVTLSEKLWMISQSVGLVLFSRTSNIEEKDANILTPKICRGILFISILSAIIIYFLVPFLLPLFYGKKFIPAISPFRYLLPGIAIMAIFMVLHGDLAGRGKARYAFFSFSGALVLNIILNVILIPKIGIDGAAIASSISYITGSFLLAYIFSRKNLVNISDLLIIKRKDLKESFNIIKSLPGYIKAH